VGLARLKRVHPDRERQHDAAIDRSLGIAGDIER
jgi:hypothetical protein